ncbi:hypothetical protein AVEN_116088-1 [Araneus ventricosus]|uniref:Uncharacterized protein n=1 Tax=Araneus ventricosus TaxID=182803 RepID=A0A4Y2VTD7_ARAVE|nr:hypothetical protein AVEN_116088-1 [Araneus ventricosus]
MNLMNCVDSVYIVSDNRQYITSKDTAMGIFRQTIDKRVSDVAFFGFCPNDKYNYFDIKFKQDYASCIDNSHCSKDNSSNIVNNASKNAEIVNDSSSNVVVDNIVMNASNNVETVNDIHSNVVADNIVMNNVVNDKPSFSTTPSNIRKRTASMRAAISNSRIRIDNYGYKYPSKWNTVPIRSTNVVNDDIVFENKFADLAQLSVGREFPPSPPQIQPLMVKNNCYYKTILKKSNDELGNINASLAIEYIKVYPETAERYRDSFDLCKSFAELKK